MKACAYYVLPNLLVLLFGTWYWFTVCCGVNVKLTDNNSGEMEPLNGQDEDHVETDPILTASDFGSIGIFPEVVKKNINDVSLNINLIII